LVSEGVSGAGGAGDSDLPSISFDGSRVVFLSAAGDLVANDTNDAVDAFLYDGSLSRVSLRANGRQISKGTREAALSHAGEHVALVTSARLSREDEDRSADVYVRELASGRTTLVSITARGGEIKGRVSDAALSDRASSVAFTTPVAVHRIDLNGVDDVYVKNASTGATPIISLAADGTDADGPSRDPSITAGGRVVAFESDASDLIDPDTNGVTDIFVRDRGSRETVMASVSSEGTPGNGPSFNPYIAPGGRYVVFESDAGNLVPEDDNGQRDVFLHDLATRHTIRVSVTAQEGQLDGPSTDATVSSDGHFVVFTSSAEALVGTGVPQVFLRDLLTGATRLLSETSEGSPGSAASGAGVVAGDASFIAFSSYAADLAANDGGTFADIFGRSPY
jgi:Tol biopolymer transport system component